MQRKKAAARRRMSGSRASALEVGEVPRLGRGVEIERLAAGAVGAAEIGLIERIGEQHDGATAAEVLAPDGRQRREEQALARAVEGQHLARKVDRLGEPVAPDDPAGDRLAQLVRAADPRIGAEQLLGLDQLVGHERRHRLLGIAGGHLDGLLVAGLDAVEQARRPGERRQDGAVRQGLQAMHCGHGSSCPLRVRGCLSLAPRRRNGVRQNCVTPGPCARPPRGWRRSCGRRGRRRDAPPRP